MKFIQVMQASSFTDNGEDQCYYAFIVRETTHTIEKMREEMVDKYGRDYATLTINDMMEEYEHELLYEFSKVLSEPSFAYELHRVHQDRCPDAKGLSSTTSECVIPFDESIPIRDVITIRRTALQAYRKLQNQSVSRQGFIEYLENKAPNDECLAYMKADLMSTRIARDSRGEPILMIENITSSHALPAISIKAFRALDIHWTNYNKRVQNDNHRHSQTLMYKVNEINQVIGTGEVATPA